MTNISDTNTTLPNVM